MATDLADLRELRCPYCGKPLNSDEYEHAIEEFKNSAAAEYKEQQRKDKQELKAIYDKQVQDVKKNYEELDRQRREDLMESFAQKKAEYDHKLQEKETQLRELENGVNEFRGQAIEEANKSVRNEIEKRDTQINRLQGKVEELAKQLTQTQSELKGEVGEVNLLRILEDAFKEKGDLIVKTPRGSLGPEIIHHIRTATGELLENKIGYDNKEGRITKQDLEKAKRDKKKFGFDHFIIVSQYYKTRASEAVLWTERRDTHSSSRYRSTSGFHNA
jgi:DNA repair exonuclease SbcCD ATPase subunit